MESFKTYLEKYHVGMKEFNGMASSKLTQLRSDRTKAIYQYFHNSVLPAMSVIEPKIFKAIVKSLSQVYRNKDIDVEETIGQIEPLLVGDGKPRRIDTHTPSPSYNIPDPQVPESPSHKVSEKKKMMKTCSDKKKVVKKLVKSLKPTKEEESQSETDTE